MQSILLRGRALGLVAAAVATTAFAQSTSVLIDATGDGVSPLTQPAGVTASPSGNVYVAGELSNNVFRIAPGGAITEVLGPASGILAPMEIAVDAAENLYVVCVDTREVVKVTPGGTVTRLITIAGDGVNPLFRPHGVAVAASGNVYVTGFNSDNAFRITPAGVITQIIGPAGDGVNALRSPLGVLVDAAENVYVAGNGSDNVFKITSAGIVTQIASQAGDGANQLRGPGDLGMDAAGNLYVTGEGSHNAFRISPAGVVTQIISAAADGIDVLNTPLGLGVDSAASVYVMGRGSDNGFRIRSGVVQRFIDTAGNGVGPFTQPDYASVDVDSAGTIYVTSRSSGVAYRIECFSDTAAPAISCPADIVLEGTNPVGEVVSFGASATDGCDPAPAVLLSPASGSTFSLGVTEVTASATDADGNVGLCSFDVTVQDTTAPVVTCPADIVAEATSPAGAVVGFVATASDAVDPAPAVVSAPPSGSIFPLGVTPVVTTATDGSGNAAVCGFTVTVQDTTAPDLVCPADLVLEATSPAGAAATFAPTATDVADPAPLVETSLASGATFPLGTTTVDVTATDASGNVSTCSFDVTVQDTTAPDLVCPADLVLEATSPAGAVATFAPTATDVADPAPLVETSPASGATFPLGTTTVDVTATDASGNVSTCSFDVTVQDTTAPALVCPGDFTVEVDLPAPIGGGPAVAVFFDVTATDVVDPAPLLVVDPASGTVFDWGTTTVSCAATDASGNVSLCSFDVTVRSSQPAVVPSLGSVVLPAIAATPPPGAPAAGRAAGFGTEGLDVPIAFSADEPYFLIEASVIDGWDQGARLTLTLSDGVLLWNLMPADPVELGRHRAVTVYVDLPVLFPDAQPGDPLTLSAGLEPGGAALVSGWIGDPRFHADCELRNGSGVNPVRYVGTGTPRIGVLWQGAIDPTWNSEAALTMLVATESPLPGVVLSLGELLVDPRNNGVVLLDFELVGAGANLHDVAVPNDPTLIGRTFATQGAVVLLGPRLRFLNAVDLTIR